MPSAIMQLPQPVPAPSTWQLKVIGVESFPSAHASPHKGCQTYPIKRPIRMIMIVRPDFMIECCLKFIRSRTSPNLTSFHRRCTSDQNRVSWSNSYLKGELKSPQKGLTTLLEALLWQLLITPPSHRQLQKVKGFVVGLIGRGRTTTFQKLLLTSRVVKWKIASANSPGFQAQIDDLHSNCCIPKENPKNNISGRKSSLDQTCRNPGLPSTTPSYSPLPASLVILLPNCIKTENTMIIGRGNYSTGG